MSAENLIEEYNAFDEKEELLQMAKKKHERKQGIYRLIWNVPWRKTWGDIASKTTKQKELITAIEEGDEISYDDWKDAFSCLPEEKITCCAIGILTGGLIWHFLKK